MNGSKIAFSTTVYFHRQAGRQLRCVRGVVQTSREKHVQVIHLLSRRQIRLKQPTAPFWASTSQDGKLDTFPANRRPLSTLAQGFGSRQNSP